ncbi:MAG: bifunctional (p)ppGpp synthetase/guanosine-3',5'-bis(diphosphate) 3'-pyrophosphohydrolase [Clostridia bacterium]|nr:bifunctional (p)ppGpp synthetase/guanosine-3',5'-bis(diphosphate) 3'-pyrophosphohydrolase [Clostridia bacterium]
MDAHETSYEYLCEQLKRYMTDISLVERAYVFAEDAHRLQKRKSGEAYIVHPVGVAVILAELEMDPECIAAGLLHDVIEDVEKADYNTVKENFGEVIANLVEGVTKLDKIPFVTNEERQIENVRKMFFAMASDIRVIIIKLADRLHNMRTLMYMPGEKQLRIAKETLDIYAPLAHRLGLQRIKWELEDLSLKYLDSVAYYEIADSVHMKKREREDYVEEIIKLFKSKLSEMDIEGEIKGRVKHYYSIYRKMFTQDKSIDEIFDLFAVRIIVKDLNDCYAALGMVHEMFTPMPGRVKDYIAMPKPNMYQSLHTTVIGPKGYPFEVQIRTWQMHQIAENGIAAHWKYKEGKTDGKHDEYDAKLAWVRDMLEIQKDVTDTNDFLNMLKIDMFSDEVFVFTPKGAVISLPAGATPVDLAFAIHSAIGYKMTGAKVNSKISPIDYKLQNGDIVEILTSTVTKGPKQDWIKFCKTTSAKNKINQWFKKEQREVNIAKGKELIERELKKYSFAASDVFEPANVEAMLEKFSFNTIDDMYVSVGCGTTSPIRVVQKLIDLNAKLKAIIKEAELTEKLAQQQKAAAAKKHSHSGNGIVVKGEENLLARISKCCSPVPGDDIIGFITRGRGVSVHRKDCINVQTSSLDENSKSRLIECEWDGDDLGSFDCHLLIHATDRRGLLAEITFCLSEQKLAIGTLNATNKNNLATVDLTVNITDSSQIELITKKLHMIPGVYEVIRA